MKRDCDKFARKIIAAYEKNSSCLEPEALGHFFVRAYKISGNKKYMSYISKSFKKCRLERIKDAPERIKGKRYPSKPFNKSIKNERAIKRGTLYEKNPMISFYNLLLMDLLYLKKFGLHKNHMKKEYREIIKLLRAIDFGKIYLNQETIDADSSYSINTICLLKKFEIADLIEGMERLVKKIYFTDDLELKKGLTKASYCSLIYDLTHIIISTTGFYEQKIKNYKWITSFFNDNIGSIEQNVTEDILAEVGLCFKLRGENNHPILKKIQDNFINNWPWEKLNNREFLIEKEHTHSLLMLLFSKRKNFYPGPDLTSYKNRL